MALITLLVNIFYTNRQLAELNQRTGEALVAFKTRSDREEAARKSRNEQLRLLLSASSIANSAAKDIVYSPERADNAYRISLVARSISKLSTFLDAIDSATNNPNLTEEDRSYAEALRTGIMTLFLKLDLDTVGPVYQGVLREKLSKFETSCQEFRNHVAKSE